MAQGGGGGAAEWLKMGGAPAPPLTHPQNMHTRSSLYWHGLKQGDYYLNTLRYELMKSCWQLDPKLRPSFASINTLLDKYLEELAGYMNVQSFLFPEIRLQREQQQQMQHEGGGGGRSPKRNRSSTMMADTGQKLSCDVTISVTSPRGSHYIV